MSSRLKRKLGDLGVDTSSNKANESFCLIGTPLPPLEKSKDNGEFVPLWKQDVRDEKGRRRLHGAFTGGFSAGYFNSVGSKEGWAPSTFVSSRGDRAKQKAARPEDFMDDEDLQELKDSRNLVDTTDEMDLTGGGKAVEDPEQESVAAALETSLLPAPTDSAGARILKKMGWRIGQGIGPRVTLRRRKMQDMQSSFDPKTDSDMNNIPEDDEEAAKHTYAPRDTPLLLVDRKDNSHGLGYHPGMGLNESLGVKNAGGAKGPRLAAGFGLGALNDADEDDLDVYDGSFSSNRRREAYDNVERDDDDTIAIGGRSDKARKPEVRSSASVEVFRDGTPVLAGFILSDKPVSEDRWFPLPDIPKGWTPDPRRVWGKDFDKENAQRRDLAPPKVPGKLSSRISADERGTILGETPLPSAPRSVFEYMSQKDRERLQNIASSGGQPTTDDKPTSGSGPASTSTSVPPATIRIPRTEPHIAKAALRGFQPFASEPVKQSRYNAYLQSQESQDSTVPPLKPAEGQKIDEFNKEVQDYAKAALLFKPISGAMAGRFTSAAVIESGPKVHEGLHTPSFEEIAEKEALERKKEEENISPKAHAAKLGMYGPLTREAKPWQPARLLCKRFGVKDPNPPSEAADDASPSVPGSNWQQPEFPVPTASGDGEAGVATKSGGPRDLSNIGLGEDDDQGRDTLTYEKPPMDVFKAIFASDDEDSDGEGENNNDEGGNIDGGKTSMPASAPQGELEKPIPTDSADAVLHEPAVVDLSSFRPTFIPRDSKSKKDKDKGRDKELKERRKKKKAVLVSFEMDEGGGESVSTPKPSKDRPKKKRREKREGDDDAGIWVEKPASDAVKDLLLGPPPPESPSKTVSSATEWTGGGRPVGPAKGRKRAIDFL